MTEPLCKDCKHYRQNWRTLWEPCCARKVATYSSIITGETKTKPELIDCSSERLIARNGSNLEFLMMQLEICFPKEYCGNSGRYWEARE